MAVLFALVPLFFLARRKPWLWFVLFSIGIIEVLVAGRFWQPIVYLPFAAGFYYGFKAKGNCLERKGTLSEWFWPTITFLGGATANFFIRKYAAPTTYLETFLMTITLRTVQTLIGISLVLLLLRMFRFLGEQKKRSFLSLSDRVSYPFFLVHFALMVGAFNLGKIIHPWPRAVLAALLGSFVLSYLISLLTRKAMRSLPLRQEAFIKEHNHA